jgi:hypothetical protein
VDHPEVWYAEVPRTLYDPEQRIIVIPEAYTPGERARALAELGRRVTCDASP